MKTAARSLMRSSMLLLVLTARISSQVVQGAENQAVGASDDVNTAWPQFRGRSALGVAEGHPLPVKWDVATSLNVRWRTPVPGLSHSSPVVFGNRIFITTSVGSGETPLKLGYYGSIQSVEAEGEQDYRVMCLHRETGQILWSRTVWSGTPDIKRHPMGSHAAATPTTDGRFVVSYFGSEGLYVHDVEGKLLWKRSFGSLDAGYYRDAKAQWGIASSPILYEGRIILQCDVQAAGFLSVLRAEDGQELWRAARVEVPTWGTPTVHAGQGRRQIIVNGYRHMGGYDLDTGRVLWKLSGGGDIPVPTPFVAHDLIFLASAHGRMAPTLAISPMARGELSIHADESEHVIWSETRRGNYLQTPLVYGDRLYNCNSLGALRCLEAKTGREVYTQRMGGQGVVFTASPVGGDDKVYFTTQDGEVYVLGAGKTYHELSVNALGESCLATPAISRGVIFFRTRGHLIAIGTP